jgi:hypothetical protein
VCVTGAIVIQMQIVDRYLLNRPPVCCRYTIISIGVTLIAVLVYYLKDKIR